MIVIPSSEREIYGYVQTNGTQKQEIKNITREVEVDEYNEYIEVNTTRVRKPKKKKVSLAKFKYKFNMQ